MINIEIDALTNSIKDRITGEEFETEVVEASLNDIKNLENWNFDWQKEFNLCKVYKLVLRHEPTTIQGLISILLRKGYVYASLMESASYKNKRYVGIAGNLIAFACKVSFETNNEGYVNFIAKTALIEHYKLTLKATVIAGQNMMIEPESALFLVQKYFKNFKIN